jgi:hypothetical protein
MFQTEMRIEIWPAVIIMDPAADYYQGSSLLLFAEKKSRVV